MLRGAELMRALTALPADELDAAVDELLGLVGPPPPDIVLPPGAVPYLPCSAQHVIALVQALPLTADDVLVDLGAGIGRALQLAHLLSGARCIGIELQPRLVASGTSRTRALGLSRVQLVCGDAATTPIAGDVVFMYAPFNGALRRHVLTRLQDVPAVIATVDMPLDDEPWLTLRTEIDALAIYDHAAAANTRARRSDT